jgi:hypothetical protein
MLYWKHVALDSRKQLEDKYKIKIDLNDNVDDKVFSMKISKCSKNILPLIAEDIKNESTKKFVECFSTEFMPGLAAIFGDKSTFKHELFNISSKLFQFIFVG